MLGPTVFFQQSIKGVLKERVHLQNFVLTTLSEAISSLGCRRNSSSGSMLIRQLTELQIMTSSRSVETAGISVNSVGYHRSPLS